MTVMSCIVGVILLPIPTLITKRYLYRFEEPVLLNTYVLVLNLC